MLDKHKQSIGSPGELDDDDRVFINRHDRFLLKNDAMIAGTRYEKGKTLFKRGDGLSIGGGAVVRFSPAIVAQLRQAVGEPKEDFGEGLLDDAESAAVAPAVLHHHHETR